ncbi:tetratricopeptide repeat protein [Vibrio ponticus]|uniref:Tetratricopeptide repeat protein n=1 Tax=Vibrio ponticus TaxID=265668 RepID=A0A3N3E084_9VIBR|nr:tetratricopeptide repeat protein [Vibrio ponticus]ROV60112.1 tetratricopeptide repeat protein [Vibrio ponticus]
MWIKTSMIALSIGLLAGCASSDTSSDFDSSLYAGKPVESLTSAEPPKSEEEALARGDMALANNDIDLALYEYLRSLSFSNAKHKDKTLYTVGKIHQSKPDLALAERAFQASLQENPDNVGALEELGALYSRSGRVDEGMSYFIKAINADLIRLKQQPSLTKESLTMESIAELKYDSSSPDGAYNGLGVLYDIQGEHDIAQSLFVDAIEIDNNNLDAIVNLGYSYYMSQNYPKAMVYTKAALQRDNNNEKALNNLALVYLAQNQVRQALNVFSRHLSAPEALNNIGYFLILQGKAEEAIPYLQQAIDKNPTYYEVANENLERALSMVRQGTSNSTIIIEQ